jgi:hypothetical protein
MKRPWPRWTRRMRSLAAAVAVMTGEALVKAQEPAPKGPPPTWDLSRMADMGFQPFGTPGPDKPPVFLVHGFGGSEDPKAFNALAEALDKKFSVFLFAYEKSMVPALVPPDPNTPSGAPARSFVASNLETSIATRKNMADVSAGLARAGEYVAGLLGSSTINYIGFSAGGVAVLGAVSTFPGHPDQYTLAGKPLHANLITLDAPLHGTSEQTFFFAPVVAFFSHLQPPITVYLYDLLGNRRSWYLNGTPGANTTWFLFYSPNSGVVRPAGQQPINGKPIGTDTLDGIHSEAPILPANIEKIVRKLEELNAEPTRTRRVSSAPTTDDVLNQFAVAPAAAPMPLMTGFGGQFATVSFDDIPLSSGTSTLTARQNGQVISTRTTVDDPATANGDFDHLVDVDYKMLYTTMPLPRTANGRLIPAVEAMLGEATPTLVLARTSGTLSRQRFASRGLFGGIGGNAFWSLTHGPDSMWYVNGAFRYERVANLDVTRDPVLPAPGAVVTESDTLAFQTRTLQGLVGFQSGQFGVAGGIRSVARRITLVGDVSADFSSTVGVPAVQTIHFDTVYAETSVEPVARVDVQLGNTPLVAHADVAMTGKNRSLQVGLTYNPSLRVVRGVAGSRKPTSPVRAESR